MRICENIDSILLLNAMSCRTRTAMQAQGISVQCDTFHPTASQMQLTMPTPVPLPRGRPTPHANTPNGLRQRPRHCPSVCGEKHGPCPYGRATRVPASRQSAPFGSPQLTFWLLLTSCSDEFLSSSEMFPSSLSSVSISCFIIYP